MRVTEIIIKRWNLLKTVFPYGLDGKESTCNAGDLSSVPGLGRSPGAGYGNPLQYSSLENPHGWWSLAAMGWQRVGPTE